MSEHVPGAASDTSTAQQVQRPKRFKVLLHNDDYTTMEFVVAVLRSIFNKPVSEAVRIMLNVHERGLGVAGVYPKQVAETKVATVHNRAHDAGYPLRCSIEPE